jgi:two-component system OmpR family sensor kinase
MKPRFVSRFDKLPIRWRLAVTSAILTFLILLGFGLVIAFFTERQMVGDFNDDVRDNATRIQDRLQEQVETTVGGYRIDARDELLEFASADDVAIRVLDANGDVRVETADAPELGPPKRSLEDVGEYRVTSRELTRPFDDVPVAYVQYAKSRNSLSTTIARLRVFLALGVLGGGALALLAGLAVARRAMEPISGLTRTARRVAKTRNPEVELPRLRADDEIADLSHTLDDMLGELAEAHTETEDALGRQRQFVADASHELRTPLTSILANLELLEAELEGEDREIAASALRSSQRMRRLVADLLLLARADAGRQAPREPVDFAEVVREAAGEAAPLAERHELELDATGKMMVDGSADDLHRLALNLIQNALVHTPAGTRVCVRLHSDDDGALLEVEDDGPGVPAELRHRLFERFVRGHGDTGGGSGLGLAIVRAVAETHGGSVELTEREGGGARFVVKLPPARARDHASRTRAGQSDAGLDAPRS